MDNQGENLLIPQDFTRTIPETINYFIIDKNFEASSSRRDNSIQILQDFDIKFSNLMANEVKESSNPIFKCLNPKIFFTNHCFNTSSNSQTIKEEPKFSPKYSYTSPVMKLKSDNGNRYLSNEASNTSACHSLSESGGTGNVDPPQSALINNSENYCKITDLLTPDSFVKSLPLKSEKDSSLDFPVVHEVLQEAHISVKKSNASTNNVQINCYVSEDQSLTPCFSKESDKKVFQVKSVLLERKCHLNDEKHGTTLLTPENFSNISSVRRKLNFKSPQVDLINEAKVEKSGPNTDSSKEKNKPEFHCALKIPENIYENLSLESRDNVLSAFSFQKNPFPPIGVFWDIENCRVPKGLSATHVVQAIRNKFFDGYKEAEFLCVCDTLKENPKVLEELNDAQVNIMHVGSVVKNAADDKLLQSMRRFADIHGAGSSIILISGDSDFATELYDLHYRKKLHVILVHNAHAQDSLKLSAHETALFSEVTQELPQRSVRAKSSALSKEVIVWNLPPNVDPLLIRRRLHSLSSNCGGKAIIVHRNSAKVAFNTPELAARAKKRIDGEYVYGSRVFCTFGKQSDKEVRGRHSDMWFSSKASSFSFRDFDRRETLSDLQPFRGLPELTMEFSNRSSWNRSSSSSNNMNDSYSNAWRMSSPSHTINNGHGSFASSPAFNSSSQSSSSRETSPSNFLNKNSRVPYSQSPLTLPMSNGCQSESFEEFVLLDPPQEVKEPHPLSENMDENLGPPCATQPEPHYGLSNLSLIDTSQVEDKEGKRKVALLDRSYINDLWLKSRKILWDESSCSLPLKKFVDTFTQKFRNSPDIEMLKKELKEYFQIVNHGDERVICLTPHQAFARDLLVMLKEAGGRMLLMNFESSYFNRFGVACHPSSLGFPSLMALLQSLGDMVHIKGKRMKRILVLNRDKVTHPPNYCPPVPSTSRVKAKATKCSVPFIPVVPPPALSLSQNDRVPAPTSPCDQKVHSAGLTAPTQQTRQPPSPVICSSESPVVPSGSVAWSHIWSPQCSERVQHSSANLVGDPPNPNELPPPELLTVNSEDMGDPPNPNELPPPELLTVNSEDMVESNFAQAENGMTSNVRNDDMYAKMALSSLPPSKTAKTRLAAYFGTQQ